ncbi:glycosyltransferase family 2 protein [Paenibacillus chartarius]|uniref:Glycosyltransferase family 2 protein n=1 Tax=Paenibacillus chartarius TaxID=747481 RepID=A0ABV6DEZ1_9BACL
MPKVTVIIPTYNQKFYLQEAVESVMAQDYPNLEILIADDCSNDGTDKMMEQFLGDHRIRYIRHEKNFGTGLNTRHVLYNMVNGEYVLVLNHDDYLIDRGFITKAAQLLHFNPKLSFVWANCNILDVNSGQMTATNHNCPAVVGGLEYFTNYGTGGYYHITSVLTTVFRREDAVRMNCYFEESKALDLFLHLKLMLTGDVGFINDHVAVYRIHDGGISLNLPSGFDRSTIKEFQALKSIAHGLGVYEGHLNNWLSNQVFSYYRWRFISLWGKNRKKTAVDLLLDIKDDYPIAYEAVLNSI